MRSSRPSSRPLTPSCEEIRYRAPIDRQKFEIIQGIRTLTRLHEAHADKRRGDFHFPTPAQVSTRWSEAAIHATHRIAERCEFAFEFHRLRFPRFTPSDGSTPHAFLARLAFDGLRRRYGERAGLHEAQLREELGIIAEVGYEEYFLTVWDILQECQRRGIAWITRGSAADSLVCYCLGISGVCPIRFDLYFRRFLNRERMALNKLPDIDIDFAHDRKDDVVDLIFERYGPHHAAIVGGFSTYQGRSAVADIAKVLGVSEYQVRRLTERVPRTSARHVAEAVATSQECREGAWSEEPYKTALEMAAFLDGFPRHPKMHPCGVVLSRNPIVSLTPTFTSAKGYATTHFDMEAVEAVGLVKMDILAQGGLAVIRDTLALLREQNLTPDLEHLEPWDDARIWQMISTGEARGVHHIESPATGGPHSSDSPAMKKAHRNLVGTEIRRRRRHLGWSQSRLARHLQIAGLYISRSGLAKIECGMLWVGDFELLYFVQVLGVRLQDLFPSIESKESLNDALARLLGASPIQLRKKANG